MLSDGVNTYIYDAANRLISVNGQTSTTYVYAGLGDRHQQNGVNYTLDLNAGLTQVLIDGTNTYLYGNGRISQHATQTEYFLGDALGSVRQLADATSAVTLTQSYAPYGDVTQSTGTSQTSYGFTNEFTDPNGLVYLRARYYAPTDGRFVSRDTWGGDYNRPLSLNRWGYVEGNPVNFVDPSGLMPTIYGIEVDDNFSEDEKTLILETISEYAQLLGGNESLKKNLAVTKIEQNWNFNNPERLYNAQYDKNNNILTLQPGWYSPVMVTTADGECKIITSPPSDEMLGFPAGSLPTTKIVAKFVLAHEMTHAFEDGNPDSFTNFKDNVDIPWTLFAWFSSNPIIKRNAGRAKEEVFADVIAAYLYSQELLNQQMSDWVETKMSGTLK